MIGTQILDVAIGLIFIFLMLSLAVTALNELMAALFKRRSAMLRQGVVRLLGDENLAEAVYSHPLISSLSRDDKVKPSYIPSRTFVLAVLDVLTGAGAQPPATTQAVAAALGSFPKGLATAMIVMLNEAAGDMEKFKKGLDRWFDNAMERVSGWYKRRNQWILLPMAAVVTIWANADAIALASALYRDPTVRSALVEQAKQYPTGEGKEMAEIDNLAIPLGWRDSAKEKEDRRDPIPDWAGLWPTIADHGLGWLLTILAISLGAPFWFDMLNKVVSIRNSGKSPEETKKK